MATATIPFGAADEYADVTPDLSGQINPAQTETLKTSAIESAEVIVLGIARELSLKRKNPQGIEEEQPALILSIRVEEDLPELDLSKGDTTEVWSPGAQGGRWIAYFYGEAPRPVRGRFFKAPMIDGKRQNSWQFVHADSRFTMDKKNGYWVVSTPDA